MVALLALEDECSPSERGEALKQQGNAAVRVGTRVHLRRAVTCYTTALVHLEAAAAAGAAHGAAAVAVCRCNRAHAAALLGNHGAALADARAARALDPTSVKACFRGARAAVELSRGDEAAELSAAGLALDPSSPELRQLAAQAADLQQKAAVSAVRAAAAGAAADAVAAALEARGARVGPPVVGGRGHKPWLEGGVLHWRLVLVYPESGQSDLVEAVSEEDSLDVHLDAMFGPTSPPLAWDAAGAYRREALEVFYQTDMAPAYSPAQLRAWLREGTAAGVGAEAPPPPEGCRDAVKRPVRVDSRKPLRALWAAEGHVAPSSLLLFVLPRGSSYRWPGAPAR